MLIRIVNMEERRQDDLRFFFPVVFESGQVFSAVIGAFGMSGKRFFYRRWRIADWQSCGDCKRQKWHAQTAFVNLD